MIEIARIFVGSGCTRCHAHALNTFHVRSTTPLDQFIPVCDNSLTVTLSLASHSCLFPGLGSRSSGGERRLLLALRYARTLDSRDCFFRGQRNVAYFAYVRYT